MADNEAIGTREGASTGNRGIGSGAADLAMGLVLVGGAGLFIWQALGFEEPDHTGVGPATFPMGIAILLAVCGLLLAARGVLGLTGVAANARIDVGRPWSVVLGIALVAAFPLMMTTFGYYPTMAVWLPAFLVVAGYHRPFGILLYTAGFLGFAKVAFELMLGVRLP